MIVPTGPNNCQHPRATVTIGPTTDQCNHHCPDCHGFWTTWPTRLTAAAIPLATPPAHGDGEGDIEAAAIALANHDRKHPNARAYWDWLHDDEKAKFRSKARAVLSATRPTPEERDCTCPSGDGSLRWPCPKHPPVDANVAAVQRKLGKRSVVGLRKYGVSTERGDLSHADWMRHLQEELMDAAVYVEAALALPAQGEGENG